MKKLLTSGIEAGNKVKAVREVVKTYKTQKQDMYDDTSEILKPSIEVQKKAIEVQEKVKETIDEKQNKVIKQLQNNQQALTEGIEKNQRALAEGIFNRLREIAYKERSEEFEYPPPPEEFKSPDVEIPIPPKPAAPPKPVVPPKPHLDITKNFNKMDLETIEKFNFTTPSNLMKMSKIELLEEKNLNALKAKSIGSKKSKAETKDEREVLTSELTTLKKHRQAIDDVLASKKYMQETIEKAESTGEGIYMHKKRNAYKISQKGQYGGLVIDLPKLHGHLKVVAHKNGQKVYDKQADFDTLDLLTKRFNSRKN